MKTRHNNGKYINRGGKQNGKMIEGTEGMVLALPFFLSLCVQTQCPWSGRPRKSQLTILGSGPCCGGKWLLMQFWWPGFNLAWCRCRYAHTIVKGVRKWCLIFGKGKGPCESSTDQFLTLPYNMFLSQRETQPSNHISPLKDNIWSCPVQSM